MSFHSPPISCRPKFRWSWPGVAVESEELVAELEEMGAAGYGGAEIATIEFGLPPDGNPPETCMWGTDRWAQRIAGALAGARAPGMTVDLTIGPGWPWASPAVSGPNIELSQQHMMRGEQVLAGPARGAQPIPVPGADGWSDAALVAVTAARALDSGEPLSGRTTILNPDTCHDLTSFVDASGVLQWEVPEGEWIVFGFWRQPTGQKARSAIPNVCDPPNVVDHMRRESAEAALRHLDEHLIAKLDRELETLGEVFEDSLELLGDGLFWTPAFLTEFRDRRGYELAPHLPVVRRENVTAEALEPAETDYDYPDGTGERVRRDYHQTLTDLWVDGHLTPMREWANRHGLESRVQVYGQTFDNIAAAKAVDIPETEDLYSNTIDFYKTIASGAHLTGRSKVSMEHGVVISADYMMTLRELKRRADKAFSAGVNQVMTCVYPYRYAHGARWPTYAPWSSSYLLEGTLGFSEAWNGTNPQWPHLRPLGDYLARAQAILRAGRPVADVAVYRDLYGYPTQFGELGTRVPLGEDTPEPELNLTLTHAGFTFDFVNPATLVETGTEVRDGRLVVQDPGYRALVVDLDASRQGVVDHSRAMDGATASRLVEFARAGLPLVFIGRFPARGVSYRAPEAEDAEVRGAVAELQRLDNVRLVDSVAGVTGALAELSVRSALEVDPPCDVYAVLREVDGARMWFLWNEGNAGVELVASFEVDADAGPRRVDLWTGASEPLGRYERADGRTSFPLRIGGRETLVIAFDQPPQLHVVATDAPEAIVDGSELKLRSGEGGAVAATLSDGRRVGAELPPTPAVVEPARWELRVDGVVPEGSDTHVLQLDRLADWRELDGLRHSSGRGVYRAHFELGGDWGGAGRGAYLELGEVHGGVQVRVNGCAITPASVPPDRIDLGGSLRAGANTLEVELTTTLKNRIDSLVGEPGFAYLEGRPERTQAYGLLGPVRLVPYVEAGIARSA